MDEDLRVLFEDNTVEEMMDDEQENAALPLTCTVSDKSVPMFLDFRMFLLITHGRNMIKL